jgi:CRISPR-associated protein Csc1
MGILYETEKYLHNWGLSFALFSVDYIPQPYRLQGELAQKPTYLDDKAERNLLHLNQAGIYVFPAQPIHWSYQINTFKAAQVAYYGKSKQFGDKGADKNYPINYGRAKELAVGSQYRTYIIAPDDIKIPRWIRLGKWAAKVQINVVRIPDNLLEKKINDYTCSHPINPLDLPKNTRILLYNRIVMPPTSLISQAQLSGEYLFVNLKEKYEARKEEMEEEKRKQNEQKKANLAAFKSTLTTEQSAQLPEQIHLPQGVFYGAGNIAVTA